MNFIIILCLMTMLLGAVVMDLKAGRIANQYNICWSLAGLLINLIIGGVRAMSYGFIGGLIPIVFLMFLFKLGILGAGDIKLLAAVGTFIGLNVIWIVIYGFVMCGIYGAILIGIRFIKKLTKERVNIINDLTNRKNGYTRVAFSVFILGGYIWYLLMGGAGLGI